MAPPVRFIPKRAAGGHLRHLVADTGTNVALCDFEPGQTKKHLKVHRVTRARWTQDMSRVVRDCPACFAELETIQAKLGLKPANPMKYGSGPGQG